MATEADGGPPSLREMVREEPEAVRAVAEIRDDEVKKWLLRILEEEAEEGRGDAG